MIQFFDANSSDSGSGYIRISNFYKIKTPFGTEKPVFVVIKIYIYVFFFKKRIQIQI